MTSIFWNTPCVNYQAKKVIAAEENNTEWNAVLSLLVSVYTEKIIKLIDSERQKDVKVKREIGGLSQTELGKEIKTSGQTMNYNCLKLEEVGYLKIAQDQKDGRKKICTLTDQGIVASRLI